MNDISKTAEPKSDQLNADDLLSESRDLKITAVKVVGGEQPVQIHYEGGEGRPYKPCKSMLRVFMFCWGNDGDEFVGRTIRVYNDPNVKWGGANVGGIRISHMSDIDETKRIMLTETRGRRAPYEVKPLIVKPKQTLSDADFELLAGEMGNAATMRELSEVAEKITAGNYDKAGTKKLREAYGDAVARVRGENDKKEEG